MAQLVVRDLDDDVKAKLQLRARRHGRSPEEEVRRNPPQCSGRGRKRPPGLGSRIAARFAGIGLDEDIPELRGYPAGPQTSTIDRNLRHLRDRSRACLKPDPEEHPARPVLLKLERPIVARIATIADWPLILIDLQTEEGVVGRSYLEPYVPKAMRYLIPALEDLGELFKGRRVAPAELFDAARKSLHFVGYEGLAMIAVAGLDMAAWDALAKAAGVPLCVLLGGTLGPVPAYNSNGLWLQEPAAVAAEAVELCARGRVHGPKAPARTREARRRSRGDRGGARGGRRRRRADGGLQPGS